MDHQEGWGYLVKKVQSEDTLFLMFIIVIHFTQTLQRYIDLCVGNITPSMQIIRDHTGVGGHSLYPASQQNVCVKE